MFSFCQNWLRSVFPGRAACLCKSASAFTDTSRAFNEAISEAIRLGSGEQLTVKAPFVTLSKADVVREGLRLHVPFEKTWSCYEGGEKPCGKCGTCIDRAKAFKENGVEDPYDKD